jgi:hypothetical protein
VVATDGEYLFEVMPGVDEVEPAPLRYRERAKNMVTERAAAPEEGFCLVGELIEAGKLSMDGLDDLLSGEWLGG